MLKSSRFLSSTYFSLSQLQCRSFTSTSVNNNMKNFSKFTLIYRGTELEKKRQKENPDRTVLGWSHGVRHPGYWIGNRFVLIPELIPDIIVPDLEDCELLPYVSYRAPEITQSEFTAEDLFYEVYADKIEKDFNSNKLNEFGEPLEPSTGEKLTAAEAYIKGRQTGSDLFAQDRPPMPEKI